MLLGSGWQEKQGIPALCHGHYRQHLVVLVLTNDKYPLIMLQLLLLFLQVIAGVFQSTGWPSVVAVMGNWYGKGKRGLVMGIWNAHTSLGNILGTVVAAACLQYGWGYAFIVPGVMLVFLSLVVYAVLVVQPSDVGLCSNVYDPVKATEGAGDAVRLSADTPTRNVGVRSNRETGGRLEVGRPGMQLSWQGSPHLPTPDTQVSSSTTCISKASIAGTR